MQCGYAIDVSMHSMGWLSTYGAVNWVRMLVTSSLALAEKI